MTEQMNTVLWISGVGSGLLFVALAGLIGLMYFLTSKAFFRPAAVNADAAKSAADESPETEPADDHNEEEEERDRQRRAVALAVALACAQAERGPTLLTSGTSDWRRLHRNRRLTQPRSRARTRMHR